MLQSVTDILLLIYVPGLDPNSKVYFQLNSKQ
jgi:hypothetical protein